MRKHKFCIFILILFIIGCGLKTDPKSKDSFEIRLPKKVVVKNNKAGIFIKNNDDKYQLIIERAEKTDNCTSDFKFISKLYPNSAYIDKNVKNGKTYIYRFYNLDEKINVNSASYLKTITYSKPLVISDVNINYLDETTVEIKINSDFRPLYYKVFLDDKELFKTRKDKFTILLPYKLKNILKIIPVDEFNNEGIAYKHLLINKQTAKLLPPSNIKYIVGDNRLFITWDKVQGAEGYKITVSDEKEEVFNNIYNYDFKPNEKCVDIKISSYNKYYSSEPKLLEVCKD